MIRSSMADTKHIHKGNERQLKIAGIISIVIALLVIAALPPMQNKVLYAFGYLKCGFNNPIEATDSKYKVTKTAPGETKYIPLPEGKTYKYYLAPNEYGKTKTNYIAGTLITFCSESEAKAEGFARLEE